MKVHNHSTRAQVSPQCRSALLNHSVTGLVTKRFTTLPTWDSLDPFLCDAETLSGIAGVNAGTVRKKIPAEHPDAVSKATIKKFFEAERTCRVANWHFGTKYINSDGTYPELALWFCPDDFCVTSDLTAFDSRTRQLIELTVEELNKLITLPWSNSDSLPVGPGVSQLTMDRKSNNLIEKLSKSKGLWPNPDFCPNDYFTDDIAWQMWEDFDGSYASDIISQVPKNATINRTIGITSFVGIATQGVCGDYIRSCLRAHNIDLNSLADTHRELAELGSRLGGLATVDFSMASDTLSRGLIWALLNNSKSSDRCRELYSKLYGCRTWYYNINGHECFYHKFSAMGNKFTFELESAIFTALARAIERLFHYQTPYCRKATSLGDDTIIYGPSLCLARDKGTIVFLYSELGLTINFEKSFFDGTFRESCGADYDNGRYVRGFYHKSRTVTLRDVVRLINHFTIYYGVTLITILHHCPFIREVFFSQQLSRICYQSWQFVDQLASLDRHCFGAVDTFIVVDSMSYEYFELEGGSLLSYEVKDPLKWVLKTVRNRKGDKIWKHVFIHDGKQERKLRQKALSFLKLDRMGYILAQQLATSNRRLAQRWESCRIADEEGESWVKIPGELFQVRKEFEIYQPNVWVQCDPTGINVRFRAYNPAWPIELPLRQQEWS